MLRITADIVGTEVRVSESTRRNVGGHAGEVISASVSKHKIGKVLVRPGGGEAARWWRCEQICPKKPRRPVAEAGK